MNVFLLNAAGFFIQFYPCILFVFLPFSEDVFRYPRKWVFAGITVCAMVLAVLFPAVLYALQGWNTALTANLFMAVVIIAVMAACAWLVREAPIKKVLIFSVVSFYAASQYCLVNAFSDMLDGVLPFSMEREYWSVYSPYGVVMYMITDAVLLPLIVVFVMRSLGEYIREVETEKMRREFSILVASTVVFVAMIMFVDITYYIMDYRLYRKELPLFFIVMADQILIFWLIFRESVRCKRDNDRQRTMEIQYMQYEKIAGDMEFTREMRHDMRHHYNALNDMLDRGQLDEMKRYLSRVIDTTVRRDNEVYCENTTVNGLLQYYIGMAKDRNIRCDVHAGCGDMAIDPADLTVVFGNAMENAINACGKCPGNPWIRVRAGTVHGSLAIEISNSCGGMRLNRHFQTEDGFSPAEAFLSDRADGGYGLRSISYTAQKYGGSARFRYNADEGMFTARIRLNMSPGG